MYDFYQSVQFNFNHSNWKNDFFLRGEIKSLCSKTHITSPSPIFSSIKKDPFILCSWVFCLHLCVYTMCIPGTWENIRREEMEPSGPGVVDGYETSCGCSEPTCFLQEPQVFLTFEQYLWPFNKIFNFTFYASQNSMCSVARIESIFLHLHVLKLDLSN